MEEIWRDINGYEGYQISNKGHVTKNGKLLTRGITKNDYIRVHLNSKAFYVHRLVAKAFPEICGEWFDECVVDHIDTNTLNCFANNLKVCTQTDNMKNPITVEKRWNCNGSPILQYDLEGNFIMRYESVADASRNCGCSSPSNISNCANGKTKKAYGYQWKYEDDAKTIGMYNKHKKKKLHVLQFDLDGNLIKEYGNVPIANEETGVSKSAISRACKDNGFSNKACGYIWKYKESA